MPAVTSRELARCLKGIMDGSPLDSEGLVKVRAKYPIDRRWLSSPEFWDSLTDYYAKNCSDEEFPVFFWSIYGVYSILLDNLSMLDKIPKPTFIMPLVQAWLEPLRLWPRRCMASRSC